MGVMGLVLLIACANVANLLLGQGCRAAEGNRDSAWPGSVARPRRRAAPDRKPAARDGGRRRRPGAGAVGKGCAADVSALQSESVRAAGLERPCCSPPQSTVAAAVLFGLVPAFTSTKVDIAPVLKDGEGSRSAGVRLRQMLVILQVSVSIVVMIGAVLFLRSLYELLSVDTGFARENVLVASIDMAPGRSTGDYPRLLDAMRRLPGVVSAAVADSGPLGTNIGWNIYIPGYVPGPNEPRSSPWVGVVSPGYFETMMVPLLLGRDFDDRDVTDNRNVMIVNETFATHYFSGENPIGRRVGLAEGVYDVEIIGVAKDTKYTGLREQRARMVYVPFRPGPWASSLTVHLRTAADPTALASALRQTIREIDPQAPVSNIRTVER